MNEGIIAIGMSGGVDSSVAAWMLSREWSRVVGVSHYIWKDSSCCNTETLARARAACDRLGIPFFILDLTEEFRTAVVDDFVDSYRRGETPNPCVRCNEYIRFGLFPRRVKELLLERGMMKPGEALHMATGHYVRTGLRQGRTFLMKGADHRKDQSYMLYHIDPAILEYCRFPLGEMKKTEVVKIAGEQGFPIQSVKESQDICFIEGRYVDFIRDYTGGAMSSEPGPIEDLQGNRLGTHRGYMSYTIGQRQGLNLSNGPWYVAELRPEENLVRVARKEELGRKSFFLTRVSWFQEPDLPLRALVKVRYNSKASPCTVSGSSDGLLKIDLDESLVLTPGQSAVFYDGDFVLGGGVIRLSQA
jgi:tRNA-specific 2-thiouridylase